MRRKILIALGLLLLVAAAFALFAPWKQWAEQTLKSTLARQGIEGVDFTVSALSPEGIVLQNIAFGDVFTLDEMTVSYSVPELISGQLKELKAGELVLALNDMEIIARDATLVFSAALGEGAWQGAWNVGSLEISGLPQELPALAGGGEFSTDTKTLEASGTLKSAEGSHHANFNADYDFSDAGKALVTVKDAALPWNGGVISTQNATVRFAGNERFKGALKIENIPLDFLLRTLTADRASATGVVSGTVPLVVDEAGNPVITGGVLSTKENGQITLMPDAIPGDNAQLEILRSVLANFQYKSLQMTLESDKRKQLSARLTVEGNNPDQFEGRPVKLNVQLSGDVLSLLTQSVPTLTDPEQLLKTR